MVGGAAAVWRGRFIHPSFLDYVEMVFPLAKQPNGSGVAPASEGKLAGYGFVSPLMLRVCSAVIKTAVAEAGRSGFCMAGKAL